MTSDERLREECPSTALFTDKYELTMLAAALPQIAWGLTLTCEGLSDDVTASPIRVVRGHVEVSDRPGLGIDVDEARVRRYRRDMVPRRVA